MASVAFADSKDQPKSLDSLQDRPDQPTSDGGPELGAPFEGSSAGITFRPPADSKEIRRAGVPDEIVQYINEKKQWTLKVSRFTLEKKVPLTASVDDKGNSQDGVLENTVKSLKQTNPAAEIVRNDVVNIGEKAVGLIGMRYSVGTSDRLLQQAIIQESELVYYVVDLSSPGAKPGTPLEEDNASERDAVGMFTAVLDTVRLIDRTAIRQDQDQRLYRTRALYVNVNEARLKASLIPEQWFRLIRDGKDIGYSYVVEEQQKSDGTPGINIGIRARSMPEAGLQVDAESWMFMTFDRKSEDFSNVALYAETGKPRSYASEFGLSVRRLKPVADMGSGGVDNRGVKLSDDYKFEVKYYGKSANLPALDLDLPPYYLPQAMGQLLPRLLPLNTPKTYLFAAYVSDTRKVMMRYIDVGMPVSVKLGDKNVTAVPITDRIGLEGTETIHYMSPDGRYLGSVSAANKVMVLPTDADTLKRLWKDANLTRPELHQAGEEDKKK